MFTNTSYASEKSVIINEVMWMGSFISSSDEWIELKNNSIEDIDLTGWKLTKLESNVEVNMTVISSGIIKSGGYFLISHNSIDHKFKKGESILNVEPDIIDTKVILSNENLEIKLYDSNGNLIDIAGDSNKPISGNNDNKYSMERNDEITDGLLAQSWHTSTQSINFDLGSKENGTPKAKNSPEIFTSPDNSLASYKQYLNLDQSLQSSATVTKIIDGDTIEINLAGQTQKVRLIGIDTPESADSNDFGIDVPYYKYAADNLLGKQITILVSNNVNERYDSDDRLLAIVINDNNIFNLQLVKLGYSQTYCLENPLIISDSWLAIENQAKLDNLGIWNNTGEKCIIINELLPNPVGADEENEWIELLNQCNYQVNLRNWFIDDGQFGSKPYLINADLIISPNGYAVIYALDSKIILNNTTDSVRLFNPSLQLTDEISYGDVIENNSYAKFDDGWRWTSILTPNTINIDANQIDDNANVEKIADLKNTSHDKQINISGYANVGTDTFSSQYFYIQDDSAGVQIYNYKGFAQHINIGDYLRIIGELSDTAYLRVKASEINLVSVNNIVNSIEMTIGQINNDFEGKLIQTEGIITSKESNGFYIEKNNNKIRIVIKDKTEIKAKDYKTGDFIHITAVVSLSSNNEITLLPRAPTDIIITRPSVGGATITTKTSNKAITVRGIVSALPGMISKKYFYIENSDRGWQIYHYKGLFPDLHLGDEIEISGRLSSIGYRIIIDDPNDINIISSSNKIIIAAIINNSDLNIARLVSVEGIIMQKSGNKIIISANNQEYIIYLKNIKYDKKLLKVGNYLHITGIVEKYQNQLRIVPRIESDLIISDIKSSKSKIVLATISKSNTHKININYPMQTKYLVEAPKNSYNNALASTLIKTLLIIAIICYCLILLTYATDSFNHKTNPISADY